MVIDQDNDDEEEEEEDERKRNDGHPGIYYKLVFVEIRAILVRAVTEWNK